MEKYFAALNKIEKLTPLRFAKLLGFFDSDAERIWKADKSEWRESGLEAKAVDEIWEEKAKVDIEENWRQLQKLGVKVLPITSKDYPKLLKEIFEPPFALLIRGEFPLPSDVFSVAVVGSRIPTSYGRQATHAITRDLAGQGVVIVSGLALGIDSEAHQAALEAGGRTLAVLGNGIESVYPPRNRRLGEEIIRKGGCLISEYGIGVPPNSYNFPQRNRIIAGLSRGVLVSEGKAKSGSLITATLANEFGRDVFAVPGNIFSENSAGANRLIQQGARPVLNANDILESLGFTDLAGRAEVREAVGDSDEEEVILRVIKKTPLHCDEIMRQSGLSSSAASATLSLLEMKGLARNLGGMNWVRV